MLGDEHTDRRSVGAPDSRTDDEAYGRAIDASDGCADMETIMSHELQATSAFQGDTDTEYQANAWVHRQW